MESKTLNMVVIHKQSKWSKFKRRLGGWFSSDKVGSEALNNLPQIIVTSAEESSGPQGEDLSHYIYHDSFLKHLVSLVMRNMSTPVCQASSPLNFR